MNIARAWLGATVLLFLGCGGEGSPLQVGVEPATGGGAAQQPRTGGASATGGSAQAERFGVTLDGTATSFCAGECVTLRARVRGGLPPYSYQWSEGGGSASDSLELCPSRTTQVEVRVSDATGNLAAGEFGVSSGEVTDQLTVTVQTPCEDGPTNPGDVDASTGEPGSLHTRCELRVRVGGASAWIRPSAWQSNHTVTALSDGGFMIVGSFLGTLPLVEPALQSQGLGSGFVARVDDNCQVRWARALSGASQVKLSSVAATRDGGAIVTGTFDGTFDTGNGVLTAPLGYHAGLVMAVGGQGQTRWARALPSNFRNCEVHSAVVSESGRVIIAGNGGPDTVVSLLPLGAAAPFVSALNPDGSGLWSYPLRQFDLGPAATVAVGEEVLFYGHGRDPALDTLALPTQGESIRVMGSIDDSSRGLWGLAPAWHEGSDTLNRIALSSSQELLVGYTKVSVTGPQPSGVVTLERWVREVASEPLDSRDVVEDNTLYPKTLGPITTADGLVLLAGSASGSATSEGRALTRDDKSTAYFLVYEDDLTPLAAHVAEVSTHAASWGVAVSPAGHVAHFFGSGPDSEPDELHLQLLSLTRE